MDVGFSSGLDGLLGFFFFVEEEEGWRLRVGLWNVRWLFGFLVSVVAVLLGFLRRVIIVGEYDFGEKI